MDSGVDTTQRLVIGVAIFLGIVIVLVVGYSLYVKAIRAEGELAKKEALDAQTKTETQNAGISLTGESKNSNNFNYDGLIRKEKEQATTTNFEIVNETAPVIVPEETPTEDPIPPEEVPEEIPVEPAPKPVVKKPVVPYNDDRPLTAAEIEAIRRLPVDNSPSGNLQTSLEEQSQGQYRAQY